MIDEPLFIPEHSPKELLEAIDQKFEELKGRVDRLDLKWGHFSRGMNVEIRDYLKQVPEMSLLREQYNYVMIYWTIKSRLLDLHMKNKMFGKNKIKKENRMTDRIKEMILHKKHLRPVSENDIISATLGL